MNNKKIEKKSLSTLILSNIVSSNTLDSSIKIPALLEEKSGGLLIDWILKAVKDSNYKEINISCRHKLNSLPNYFPKFNFFELEKNLPKNSIGLIYSAKKTLQSGGLIIDSGIILRKEAINLISSINESIVVGVEPIISEENKIKSKLAIKNGKVYSSSEKDSIPVYFAGVIKIKEDFYEPLMSCIDDVLNKEGYLAVEDLIVEILKSGYKVYSAKITQNWAKIYRPRSLSKFIFGTKAETLERLSGNLKNAEVLPQVKFSVKDWQVDKDKVLSQISENIDSNLIVIRSSSLSEDSFSESNAGSFKSLLGIQNLPNLIEKGVADVIKSFIIKDEAAGVNDQVLIQPFLNNIAMSGVILTADQSAKSPYNIINYEKDSGTEGVTSGTGRNIITEIVSKNVTTSSDKNIQKLINLSSELTKMLAMDYLDIEFAIDKIGVLFLLQVRPLITQNIYVEYNENDFFIELSKSKV